MNFNLEMKFNRQQGVEIEGGWGQSWTSLTVIFPKTTTFLIFWDGNENFTNCLRSMTISADVYSKLFCNAARTCL